jgi:large subunit ribosomal protein L18
MDKSSKTYKKTIAKRRRQKAIRKRMSGNAERPRLSVFRSIKNISAQIIDDEAGVTLVAYSTLAKDFKSDKTKKAEQSFEVGKKIGELAIEKGIKQIAFDRGGYLYHGRVKALADGVRKAAKDAKIKLF